MAGSSQFDIVARLQLRAEQFSSEGGRSFADLATKARTSAAGIRDSFGQSFAEVQKLAEQSLKLPRTASGSLDLSGEITSLRQAAAAADQKAAVARELNVAMLAASSSSRTVTESMRLEADAAMVAARAEEADAGAIRQRILALEAVQVQLNKSSSATVIHTRAANDNAVSAGQQQQSMLMLGQQIQDFAVQTSNGGSVATAFSQQIGQVGFALTGMGGKLASVGAFLGTFAGTATLVALTVDGMALIDVQFTQDGSTTVDTSMRVRAYLDVGAGYVLVRDTVQGIQVSSGNARWILSQSFSIPVMSSGTARFKLTATGNSLGGGPTSGSYARNIQLNIFGGKR